LTQLERELDLKGVRVGIAAVHGLEDAARVVALRHEEFGGVVRVWGILCSLSSVTEGPCFQDLVALPRR